MIRYSLACAEGHRFNSWFQSADAFDRLASARHLTCAVCGGPEVSKALMAPAVATDRPEPGPAPAPGPLTAPRSPAETALAELRARIERESEYVGLSFAREARAIHDGAAPERPIYGEAKPDEARALIEDGIPVAPLPFRPRAKSN